MSNDDNDEIMCDCSGTTRNKIISLIDQGFDDIDIISRKTGAISGCGGCEWNIEELVQDYLTQKQT